jgi:hypothetical protein
MRILVPVPWKPIVLVWGVLSTMVLVGFVTSSLVQRRNLYGPGATVMQSTDTKAGAARTGQQPKHSHKPAQTSTQR